jgi:hypothetical protein
MEEFRRAASPAGFGGSDTPSTHGHKPKRGAKLMQQKKLIIGLIVLLILAAAVGTTAYFINRYNTSQKEVKRLSNPTEAAKTETQNLIDKVGKLTVLPTGETPTVATVTDASKLKDQAFFLNAVTGDKVLIYTNAKKAFLYRPSTNKIINIAPVNLGSGTSTAPAPTTPTTTKKSP